MKLMRYAKYLIAALGLSSISAFADQAPHKVFTARAMLTLSHYQFKCLLKHYALCRGKFVIDCTEEYTSKTNPFTGRLMDIGSAKQFKYNNKIYDRDVNASRNIYIKCITQLGNTE